MTYMRVVSVLALYICTLVSACAGGGGTRAIPQELCSVNGSTGWRTEVHKYDLPIMLKSCPMVLSRSYRTFTGVIVIDVPESKNPFIGNSPGEAEIWIKNATDTAGIPVQPYRMASEEFAFDLIADYPDPSGNPLEDVYRATATVTWVSGQSWSSSVIEQDSLHVSYYTWQMHPGGHGFPPQPIAEAFVRTPVVISNAPGTITGYNLVAANASNMWRVVPDWDTTGYRFRWFVDGVQQMSDTGATLTRAFSSVGTHTIRNDQLTSDAAALTSTLVVDVPVPVTLSGPSVVHPWAWNTWTTSATAGTPPFTYSWYLDGNYAGGGTTLQRSLDTPATWRHLSVSVVDALGVAGAATLMVHVNTGSCAPEDSNCMESLRSNAPGTSPTLSPSLRRLPRRP